MAGDKSVNIFHSHMIRFESIRLFVWILVLRFGACDGLESFAGDRFTADAHAQICASILTNIQTRYFNHPLNLPGGKSYGWIRTNTAAFQQYALETSVTRLVDVLNAWRFPVNPMVKCDDISRFEVNPSYFGLNCFLQLQKRYGLLIDRNQISNFSDDDFSLSSFEHRQERLEKVLNKTNLLTTKSAEQVARNALRALGLENGQNTQLREPPHVVQ